MTVAPLKSAFFCSCLIMVGVGNVREQWLPTAIHQKKKKKKVQLQLNPPSSRDFFLSNGLSQTKKQGHC